MWRAKNYWVNAESFTELEYQIKFDIYCLVLQLFENKVTVVQWLQMKTQRYSSFIFQLSFYFIINKFFTFFLQNLFKTINVKHYLSPLEYDISGIVF